MSYFIEVSDYKSYANDDANFHFSYNANSGGGQSFLGGQFVNEDGVLTSPTVLDGKIGGFKILLDSKSGNEISFLLNDKKGQYVIKPRGEGSGSMKLGVGDKIAPSKLISSVFMLPPTCAINLPSSLDVSILTSNNFWLQSMWLKCSKNNLVENMVDLIPNDFIYCGGCDKGGRGTRRYFKLDAERRVRDILFLSNSIERISEQLRQFINVFASIYLGESTFDYDSCIQATNQIMAFLAHKYPDKYFGIEDPLPFLMSLQRSSAKTQKDVLPQQIIFYGAPGTGKSHTIKKETAGKSVIRTTFHPDSDYSTFVGAYKPVMDDVDVLATPVVVKNGIKINPTGTYKERRISYRFVKQAFLKAYLAAWKKFSEGKNHNLSTSIKSPIVFKTDHGTYTILSVDDKELKLSREFEFTKKAVLAEWLSLWSSDTFEIPTGEQSGRSVQHAIAKWIYENIANCTKDDFDEGWKKLVEKIQNDESLTVSKSKEYILSIIEGETEKILVKVKEAGKSKDQLEKVFKKQNKNQLENELIKILKNFCDDDFNKAWSNLNEAITNGSSSVQIKTYTPQFLIIEEINRGNCAQIFGDLFQLLDRSNNGYSTYPIDADTDIQREIERAFKEEQEYKIDSLDIDNNVVDDYVSNYGASLADDILHGRILLLPPNLYIWATMNTSDQSLFPIDSAFKRRWDWKYIKIAEGKDKNGNELKWKMKIGAEQDWWEFVQQINRIIYRMTSSADKQLGFFFCQATNNEIDAETFVNKVAFYLWNDVFKDFAEEESALFKFKKDKEDKEDSELTFPDFFKDNGDVNADVAQQFIENVMKWGKENKDEKNN